MANIFEQTKAIEEFKKEMDKAKTSIPHTNPFLNKKDTDLSPVYSEKTKKLLNSFKNQEETPKKEDKPRAAKTIGKESQRRGKGRGCI